MNQRLWNCPDVLNSDCVDLLCSAAGSWRGAMRPHGNRRRRHHSHVCILLGWMEEVLLQGPRCPRWNRRQQQSDRQIRDWIRTGILSRVFNFSLRDHQTAASLWRRAVQMWVGALFSILRRIRGVWDPGHRYVEVTCLHSFFAFWSENLCGVTVCFPLGMSHVVWTYLLLWN